MSPEALIAVFDGLIEQFGICLKVNESFPVVDEPISVDVEHDERGTFVCCGLYVPSSNTYYGYSDLLQFRDIDFSTIQIIAHNGRTDFDVLRTWGIEIKNEQLHWDTELISHIIDSSRRVYGLKGLSNADLGITYPSYDDIVGKCTAKQSKERKTLDKQPIELVLKYNAMDCYVTAKLYEKQTKGQPGLSNGLEKPVSQTYFEELERPVAFILNAMENRGIRVDLEYLKGLKRELEALKTPLEADIKNELGNINLNSPKQLLGALHAKEIYPTFKGKPSTDKRALGTLKTSPIIDALFKYSELDTLLTTFVTPYLERDQKIVHPWFNQCGTRTGRLSCSNPNLLQIPKRSDNGKRVRRMFIPRDGMLMGDVDFGQIEPRVLAHLSKDPVLCKMFNDGTDFHQYTAERLCINRERSKVLNLSVGYRATKYSVSRQLGGSLDDAQAEIDNWWALFPTLRRWQDSLIFDAVRSGFCTTLLGRRIRVDRLSGGMPWQREAAERQLINNITQGSAAEIMKMAMIKIDKELCHGAYQATTKFGLLVQVYDELLFEADQRDIQQVAKDVTECMTSCIKLDVPLTVDCKIGKNWGEMSEKA